MLAEFHICVYLCNHNYSFLLRQASKARVLISHFPNGTLVHWCTTSSYNMIFPVFRNIDCAFILPRPSLTFSMRWSLKSRCILLSVYRTVHQCTSAPFRFSFFHAQDSLFLIYIYTYYIIYIIIYII